MLFDDLPDGGASSRPDALLAQIVSSLSDGVAIHDDQRLVEANAATAHLLGFPTVEALLAADATALDAAVELYDEEGARLEAAAVWGPRAPGAGERTVRVHRLTHAQGDGGNGDPAAPGRAARVDRWYAVRNRAVRGASSAWLLTTFHDVTDAVLAQHAQEASEQAAIENQQRLGLALEAGAMGVFEWLVQEDRVVWSEAIERMHGIPVGSFDGTFEAYTRDMHPDDREHVLATARATLEQRQAHHVVYRIVRPDGETRWLEAHGRLVVDAAGQPQRLVGVCRDITEQRDAQAARTRADIAEAGREESERSRRQLADILDSITDPFTVYDDQLRIVSCNAAAARLIGMQPRELVGKLPDEIMPGTEGTPFVRAYRTVLRTRKPMSIEDFFAPWQRWYEANIYPLEAGIAVQAKDITVRKQAVELTVRLGRHAALRAEISVVMAEERDEARMLQRCCEALVDQLDVAFARVWILDEAAQMLLLRASAGIYTHLDGGHRAVPVGKFKIGRIAGHKEPHLTNDVVNDPEVGDPAWAAREKMVAFAGYPLLVDGRVIGVVAMFSRRTMPDDTMAAVGTIADLIAQGMTRRQAEVELEQRLQDLARSNAELEQFAYVASHDLQEPLRMVASYNQLLARRYKGKLDSDADEFIQFTVEGVTRMQRLINDLLAYSRVGTRGAERVPLELEVVMKATLSNLERAIADEDAQITYDPLPRVVGNEGQLIQLFQNLIGNAIKFRSDARPTVHIGVTVNPREVTIAVRDNGIGIEPQYFERIFVIFQRLNPREKYPGTGIGLAISKKIVERHGGRIWVESVPDRGATVLFTLPCPQASLS